MLLLDQLFKFQSFPIVLREKIYTYRNFLRLLSIMLKIENDEFNIRKLFE